MRLYVLLTSIDPVRLYIHHNGLVRSAQVNIVHKFYIYVCIL